MLEATKRTCGDPPAANGHWFGHVALRQLLCDRSRKFSSFVSVAAPDAMMEVYARVRQVQAFLGRLEQSCSEFSPRYDQRTRVWIKVSKMNCLMKCLTVPSWASWPPAWWPEYPQPE